MEAPDRQRVGIALFLSVALALVAGLADFGAPSFEHATEATLHTFDEAIDGVEGAARAVTHGDAFDVDRRQALAVQLSREEGPGWAGVLIGLVPQGDTEGDVRDVPLELLDGEQIARAHLSDVAPGVYRLRIEGATDAANAPASVQVTVTGGRRTLWPLLLAGLLVWAPALFSLLRRNPEAALGPNAQQDVPTAADS